MRVITQKPNSVSLCVAITNLIIIKYVSIGSTRLGKPSIKKTGESWEFIPTGGREVCWDPNLLTGFLKMLRMP